MRSSLLIFALLVSYSYSYLHVEHMDFGDPTLHHGGNHDGYYDLGNLKLHHEMTSPEHQVHNIEIPIHPAHEVVFIDDYEEMYSPQLHVPIPVHSAHHFIPTLHDAQLPQLINIGDLGLHHVGDLDMSTAYLGYHVPDHHLQYVQLHHAPMHAVHQYAAVPTFEHLHQAESTHVAPQAPHIQDIVTNHHTDSKNTQSQDLEKQLEQEKAVLLEEEKRIQELQNAVEEAKKHGQEAKKHEQETKKSGLQELWESLNILDSLGKGKKEDHEVKVESVDHEEMQHVESDEEVNINQYRGQYYPNYQQGQYRVPYGQQVRQNIPAGPPPPPDVTDPISLIAQQYRQPSQQAYFQQAYMNNPYLAQGLATGMPATGVAPQPSSQTPGAPCNFECQVRSICDPCLSGTIRMPYCSVCAEASRCQDIFCQLKQTCQLCDSLAGGNKPQVCTEIQKICDPSKSTGPNGCGYKCQIENACRSCFTNPTKRICPSCMSLLRCQGDVACQVKESCQFCSRADDASSLGVCQDSKDLCQGRLP